MSSLRVKICGLTDPANAVDVCAAGADAIGMVFYAPSPRNVSPQIADDICQALPPFVTKVGLFVNAEAEDVRCLLETVNLDLLQFHGDESPNYCQSFSKPYIKALRMSAQLDVYKAMLEYVDAVGFLLDAYHPSKPGGTGQSFDWQRFPETATKPLVLAGGLTPTNVSAAVEQCRPYAVDVSGGVESSAGYKSIEQVSTFIKRAKSVY